MAIQIEDRFTKENSERFVLHHDAQGRRVKSDDENAPPPAGEVVFYLRPLRGAEARRIANLMYDTDKKGHSSFNAGTVTMEKVLASVVALEGLEFRGKAVEKLTRNVYDYLDVWIINALLRRINEISEDLEDEEEE